MASPYALHLADGAGIEPVTHLGLGFFHDEFSLPGQDPGHIGAARYQNTSLR